MNRPCAETPLRGLLASCPDGELTDLVLDQIARRIQEGLWILYDLELIRVADKSLAVYHRLRGTRTNLTTKQELLEWLG